MDPEEKVVVRDAGPPLVTRRKKRLNQNLKAELELGMPQIPQVEIVSSDSPDPKRESMFVDVLANPPPQDEFDDVFATDKFRNL